MKSWLKRKIINIMLAFNWTENSLKVKSEDIQLGEGKYQSHKKGMLSDALINGEVTQEVKELRWRHYKILKKVAKVMSKIVGYDEDNSPIVKTYKKDVVRLDKYRCDNSDDEFKLIMVVPNHNYGTSTSDTLDYTDDLNNKEFVTLSFQEHINKIKDNKLIIIQRDHRPSFNLEDYTNKMLIREMTDNRVLLEFYVSMYPTDERKSRLFISEMKKILKGKHNSPVLDFNEVFFISNKVVGAEDQLEFNFKILKFHRITEYDGSYVIKFVAEKEIFGNDLLEKYRLEYLDEKYENKEKKIVDR